MKRILGFFGCFLIFKLYECSACTTKPRSKKNNLVNFYAASSNLKDDVNIDIVDGVENCDQNNAVLGKDSIHLGKLFFNILRRKYLHHSRAGSVAGHSMFFVLWN